MAASTMRVGARVQPTFLSLTEFHSSWILASWANQSDKATAELG